jgi:hypothetical protein
MSLGRFKFHAVIIFALSIACSSASLEALGINFTRTVKRAACIAALGAIAYSYTLPRYVPSREEITMRDPVNPRIIHDYDDVKNLRRPGGPMKEIYAYMFGPLFTTMDLLGRRMAFRTPRGAIKETAHEDFRYLLGYFLLYAGLRRLNNTFFQIDVDDYRAASDAKMKTDPKKVLYLSSTPEKDRLTGFPEFYFEQLYGQHPQARFISFINLEDLTSKLAELPQDNSFDRIEIFIHGSPNKIYAADKSKITSKDLHRLRDANLNIAAPDADIRFVSCSLAGGRPFDPSSSETFLRDFGKALLPGGGQIIGASRKVTVLESYLPPATWAGRKTIRSHFFNRSIGAMMHMWGMGNFRYLWYEVMPGLYRNFKNSKKDAIVVQIPPR